MSKCSRLIYAADIHEIDSFLSIDYILLMIDQDEKTLILLTVEAVSSTVASSCMFSEI